MIDRVSFIAGGAGFLALPGIARAGEPSPAASPASSAAPPEPSGSPKPRRKHVHGANGVALIPTDRVIEWKMEVLDGPAFKLSAYRGSVVFCNLFATWCEPCNHEQPDLVAFAEAHAADTVVVGVNMWEEDNDVRAYRKKFTIPYPIAMHRVRNTMPAVFRPHLSFPTTVVFRPNGMLSCAWEGARSRAWFEAEREHALDADAAPA